MSNWAQNVMFTSLLHIKNLPYNFKKTKEKFKSVDFGTKNVPLLYLRHNKNYLQNYFLHHFHLFSEP